jgi:putative exosortase-associated protein (TIGR04073 family)
MRQFLAIPFVLALLALAAPAAADGPGDKFGRGMSNLGLGIMELPAQMVAEGESGGPLWAFSLGFAKGIGRFVTRELVGVYEVATFPAPVPRGYRPILSPEYPWQLID